MKIFIERNLTFKYNLRARVMDWTYLKYWFTEINPTRFQMNEFVFDRFQLLKAFESDNDFIV